VDVVSRFEWIDEVFDEYWRTIQLTGVDSDDVVVLTEHHGAGARTSRYETPTKPHVHLEIYFNNNNK